MTNFTGKLIANTYKDILTIATSVENSGIDSTLRRVQDGSGNNSPLKLSETSAAFTGNVSVNGNLTVNGSFQPDTVDTNELQATIISATNITTNTLNAGTLIFQDVSVSSLRTGDLYAATISAGTISATNINGTNITVDGDRVVTSAIAVSAQAIFAAEIRATIANTSAALQQQIDIVSAGLSATNTQTQINATQISTLSTSIAANASAIAVNSAAITSINNVIATGAFASAGTSATLETRIATVSSTMATSINNSNTAITNLSATLESRIAGVSSTMAASIASTSATLESHINTVSAALSSTNVALQTSIGNSNTAIATLSATMATSINNSNAAITSVNTRINSVSVLAETKASAATSANLQTRINAVSVLTQTNKTSIAANASAIAVLQGITYASAGTSATLESRIAGVSSTMATSISNSNSAIATLSATMATSIANHLRLSGGTLTGSLTLNADPSTNLQAATKAYVDNLTASSIHVHEAVRVETNTTNLNATYNNGTAGVGATLTNAGTQAALVIDGVTLNTSDRVLVIGQTNQTQNGVYVVTDTGSASTNWILTRSDDADTSGDGSPDTLDEGSYFFVQEGTIGAAHAFVCNTQGTIVFGTTNITFVQFSDSVEYTAGTGININASRVISTSGVPTDAELAAVSATMATSIANSNSAIAALSATMATSINNSNTNITTNAAAITSINGILGDGSAYASAGTSAALQTKIATLSATMATSINNSNTAIATLSATMATSINNSNTAIATLSATMATSINNSNTAIATLSATMATSISNKVSKSGDTMTGNLSFGDNNKAIFGAGSDLEIFHNGSNSLIKDNGTGNLNLVTDGTYISLLGASGAQNMARFQNGGTVELYNNNSKKLNTTSGGVNITGDLDATGGIFIGGTNSYIYEGAANTINFRIGADGPFGEMIDAGSGVMEFGNAGGALALTAAGTERARLTSSGLDVTGNVVSQVSINAQTGTTYTTVLADESKLVTLNNASAITVTIPANSSVAYPVGTKIDFAQLGAGQVTFAGAGGVTVNATPTLKLRDQYSAATCIKIATDTWLLVGDLAES